MVSDDIIIEGIRAYLDNKLIKFGGILDDPEIDPRELEKIKNGEENLTITINYQHKYLILPNFANSLANILNMSAKTIMKME